MKVLDLKIGERIALKLELSDGTVSSMSFSSKIEDIKDNSLIISSPTVNDVQNWIGRTLEVTVPRYSIAYSCFAKVLSQRQEKELFLVEVQIFTDFIRVQRRNFFRLKAELLVDVDGLGKVKSVDISGNGLALKTFDTIEVGKYISGNIHIGKSTINFNGKVVRSQDFTQYGGHNYNLIGIEFVDLELKHQNMILKYIHSEQMSMIKKGVYY